MIKLGLSERDLERSRTTFYGIVPGLSCTPMGRIRLDVIFGTEENFRREPIWFEVADLSSPYHALLGLPAIAKFMLNSYVPYLKMKLPGPNNIITIAGVTGINPGKSHGQGPWVSHERHRLDDSSSEKRKERS